MKLNKKIFLVMLVVFFVTSLSLVTAASNNTIKSQKHVIGKNSDFKIVKKVFKKEVSNQTLKSAIKKNKKIYVSTMGDDEIGKGTAKKPYKTLKKAVLKSKSGTTIVMRGGIYNITSKKSHQINKNVTITNCGNETVRITSVKSKNRLFRIKSTNEVIFKNIIIESSKRWSVIDNYGRLTLENVKLYNNSHNKRKGMVNNYGNLTIKKHIGGNDKNGVQVYNKKNLEIINSSCTKMEIKSNVYDVKKCCFKAENSTFKDFTMSDFDNSRKDIVSSKFINCDIESWYTNISDSTFINCDIESRNNNISDSTYENVNIRYVGSILKNTNITKCKDISFYLSEIYGCNIVNNKLKYIYLGCSILKRVNISNNSAESDLLRNSYEIDNCIICNNKILGNLLSLYADEYNPFNCTIKNSNISSNKILKSNSIIRTETEEESSSLKLILFKNIIFNNTASKVLYFIKGNPLKVIIKNSNIKSNNVESAIVTEPYNSLTENSATSLIIQKSLLYNPKASYEIKNNEFFSKKLVNCDDNWWGTNSKPINRVKNCEINSYNKGMI